MQRTFALLAGVAGSVLLAGCGGKSEPDVVYEFRLSVGPVALAAGDACRPLDQIAAKPVDAQYEDVPGHQQRWVQARSAVEQLLRQGLELLEAQTRTEVCAHPAGRAAYGELADAAALLARSLAKSRGPWIEFAQGMEQAEILAAGLGAPRSDLEAERDKRVEELRAKVDALLARVGRMRVEQARLFLANGDTAAGFNAAGDAGALITELRLEGEAFDAIAADAAKLAAGPGGAAGDG